jgi:hypothetical protein
MDISGTEIADNSLPEPFVKTRMERHSTPGAEFTNDQYSKIIL